MFGWMRKREPSIDEQDRQPPREPTSADIYHDAAIRFLDVQISTLDALDTKITQYLSASSLGLPVTVALFGAGFQRGRELPDLSYWLIGVALGMYVLVLLFAALASRIRALEYRPDIATLGEYSETYEGPDLKQWAASEYGASIEINRKVLVEKARWVGAEALACYGEGFFLSLAAFSIILL